MDDARIERIRGWQDRDIGGPADLDSGFTGAVEAGGRWLLVLDGQCVAGDPQWLEQGGTAYSAPHDALPLLFAMEDADGETQGQYYSEEVDLRETHQTLTDAGFTGYIELAENVLSGDYYVVYHGGESRSVAFQGNNGRLLTDDEAFDTAAEEVGIYTVESATIDPQPLPDPDQTTEGEGGTDSAGGAAAGGTADGAADRATAATPTGSNGAGTTDPDASSSYPEREGEPKSVADGGGDDSDQGPPAGGAADPSEPSAATESEPDPNAAAARSGAGDGGESGSADGSSSDTESPDPDSTENAESSTSPEAAVDPSPESAAADSQDAAAEDTTTGTAAEAGGAGGTAAADATATAGRGTTPPKPGEAADDPPAALSSSGDVAAVEQTVDQIADRVNRIDRQLDEVTETLDQLAVDPGHDGIHPSGEADDGPGSEGEAGRSRLPYVVLLVLLLLVGVGALDVVGVITVPGMDAVRDGVRSAAGLTSELTTRV